MEKFIAILDQLVAFLMKLLKNIGAFGDNDKLPGVLQQYYDDAKTVGEVIVG